MYTPVLVADNTIEEIRKADQDLAKELNRIGQQTSDPNVPTIVTDSYGRYRQYPDGSTQGRTITASVLKSSAIALVSNTPKTILSISIPPNSSWIISGGYGAVDGAGTTHVRYLGAISKTTNVVPASNTTWVPVDGEIIFNDDIGAGLGQNGYNIQPYRYDNFTNAPVVLYLVVQNQFSVNTCSVYGSVQAISIL